MQPKAISSTAFTHYTRATKQTDEDEDGGEDGDEDDSNVNGKEHTPAQLLVEYLNCSMDAHAYVREERS